MRLLSRKTMSECGAATRWQSLPASAAPIAASSKRRSPSLLDEAKMKRLFLSAAFLALCAPGHTDPAIHYAPAENLEHIDVALIDTAKREIDMAAYVLTDWPVIQALTRAADRGVKVRIYLDGGQLAQREPARVFQDLAETPGVEIRTKRDNGALMHMKSYEIDGRLLRTGAANFSASGLKRQDNDLAVIESATAAARFKRAFEAQFASGSALSRRR
jgi:phosphatidylserine/phosphatidylglycerophosphate/cardiolipin synthase-like enzyme